MKKDIEIAGASTSDSVATKTSHLDSVSGFNSSGDIYGHGFGDGTDSLSAALLARVGDEKPGSGAARAHGLGSNLAQESTFNRGDDAGALAVDARLSLSATFDSITFASVAACGAFDFNIFRDSGEDFFERNVQIGPEVVAILRG